MSESEEGFSVAATRQWAGSTGAPAAGGMPGIWNGPAALDSAAVIVMSAIWSDFNCSHGVCANAAKAVAAKMHTKLRVMAFSFLCLVGMLYPHVKNRLPAIR